MHLLLLEENSDNGSFEVDWLVMCVYRKETIYYNFIYIKYILLLQLLIITQKNKIYFRRFYFRILKRFGACHHTGKQYRPLFYPHMPHSLSFFISFLIILSFISYPPILPSLSFYRLFFTVLLYPPIPHSPPSYPSSYNRRLPPRPDA